MGNPIAAALASAHKTLDSANNYQGSVEKQAGPPTAKPKPPAPKSDYSHARAARTEGEFMGQSSNAAPELNAALDKRAEAKKVLDQ